jgi:phage host-nuclease inhibitor protein Gam
MSIDFSKAIVNESGIKARIDKLASEITRELKKTNDEIGQIKQNTNPQIQVVLKRVDDLQKKIENDVKEVLDNHREGISAAFTKLNNVETEIHGKPLTGLPVLKTKDEVESMLKVPAVRGANLIQQTVQ